MHRATEVTQRFEILEDGLTVDAPVSGYLRSRATGELFAFRCVVGIPGVSWHWTLLPCASTQEDVTEVFARALRAPPEKWLTLVEDRRSHKPPLEEVWCGPEIHMSIERLLSEPATLDDVIATLEQLSADLREHPDEWENSTLERYLEAMAAWLTSCKHRIPAESTWRVFVGALQAAKIYE